MSIDIEFHIEWKQGLLTSRRNLLASCPLYNMKIKTGDCFEILITTWQVLRCLNPEYHNSCIQYNKNLTPCKCRGYSCMFSFIIR